MEQKWVCVMLSNEEVRTGLSNTATIPKGTIVEVRSLRAEDSGLYAEVFLLNSLPKQKLKEGYSFRVSTNKLTHPVNPTTVSAIKWSPESSIKLEPQLKFNPKTGVIDASKYLKEALNLNRKKIGLYRLDNNRNQNIYLGVLPTGRIGDSFPIKNSAVVEIFKGLYGMDKKSEKSFKLDVQVHNPIQDFRNPGIDLYKIYQSRSSVRERLYGATEEY